MELTAKEFEILHLMAQNIGRDKSGAPVRIHLERGQFWVRQHNHGAYPTPA